MCFIMWLKNVSMVRSNQISSAQDDLVVRKFSASDYCTTAYVKDEETIVETEWSGGQQIQRTGHQG